MVLIDPGEFYTKSLIYDAPLDEKTIKIREEFKIDESGYPEHYKWRGLARLGRVYRPEDPFLKFDPYDPKSEIPTQVTYAGLCAAFAIGVQYLTTKVQYRFLMNPWRPILMFSLTFPVLYYGHKWTLEHQGQKNAQVVDYVQKHPERFEDIFRPKFREYLFENFIAR